MGLSNRNNTDPPAGRHILFYGWIIVISAVVIQTMQFGIQYSFGVFFKPIASDFGWSRAATSGAFSVLMLSAGASAIPLGWLAERIGPAKVIAASGLLTALSLILTSRITELWQFYLTFGFLQGIAIGATIPITSGLIARWFVKLRGMALGILTASVGLGTFIMPPIAERLIAGSSWSQAILIIGIVSGIVIFVGALFLKRDPASMGLKPYGAEINKVRPEGRAAAVRTPVATETTLRAALHTAPLWVTTVVFLLFNICVQVVMVHLANYATDLGVNPLAAATIVSVIGIGSIVGRLAMGAMSDRIGSFNSMLFTSLLLVVSLIWLLFARELWMLYVFAVIFSFAYGGEMPQMPLLISRFYGLGAVISLTAVAAAGIRVGGALGSWMGGAVFDLSHSYLIAFIIAVVMGLAAFALTFWLKKIRNRSDGPTATLQQ